MADYYRDTVPQIGKFTSTEGTKTTLPVGSQTIPDSLILKSWAKKAWEAGIKESYFSKFMGRNAKSIIHVKEDLSRGKGTSINIPLLMPLVGAGVIEDNLLEGNEEPLVYRDFDVYLHQIRHAVRLQGRFEEKKVQQNLREDARSALSEWLATYIDYSIFSILTNTPPPFIKDTARDFFPFELESTSNGRRIYPEGKTAASQVEVTDAFNTDIIGRAKRLARADETTAIRPVRVDGRETYVMVIDQWQARDLKRDPKWIEAQEHANVRGEKNPIFSGAIGIWDGVVIHECNRVPRTQTGAGSGKDKAWVGHALFLGAQACVFAEGEAPRWVEKKFDYDNQYGVSISRMFGLKKSRFKFDGTNWTDFGSIVVFTASMPD